MDLSLIRQLLITFLNGVVRGFLDIGRHIQRCRPTISCVPFFRSTRCHFIYGFGKLVCASGETCKDDVPTIPGAAKKPVKCRLLSAREDLKPVLAMIVVGLTPRHLGFLTPRLSALAREGAMTSLETIMPAVTCSGQARFMRGLTPREHGIVANGWLFRDQMEGMLWREANRLAGREKGWAAD